MKYEYRKKASPGKSKIKTKEGEARIYYRYSTHSGYNPAPNGSYKLAKKQIKEAVKRVITNRILILSF